MPNDLERPQTYRNHRSNPPLVYAAAGAVLLGEACRRCYLAAVEFSVDTAWSAGVALAILVVGYYARRSAQIVQDRVIRLEMRLRLERLLGADRREEIERIGLREIIALRFASDAELPDLVARRARGELAHPDEIKRAVGSWRPDWLRV